MEIAGGLSLEEFLRQRKFLRLPQEDGTIKQIKLNPGMMKIYKLPSLEDKDIYSKLLCSGSCNDLAIGPLLRICSVNGHGICKSCYITMKYCKVQMDRGNKCKVLKKHFIRIRAGGLARLFNNTVFACPFRKYGCGKIVLGMEYEDHTNHCMHRTGQNASEVLRRGKLLAYGEESDSDSESTGSRSISTASSMESLDDTSSLESTNEIAAASSMESLDDTCSLESTNEIAAASCSLDPTSEIAAVSSSLDSTTDISTASTSLDSTTDISAASTSLKSTTHITPNISVDIKEIDVAPISTNQDLDIKHSASIAGISNLSNLDSQVGLDDDTSEIASSDSTGETVLEHEISEEPNATSLVSASSDIVPDDEALEQNATSYSILTFTWLLGFLYSWFTTPTDDESMDSETSSLASTDDDSSSANSDSEGEIEEEA